MSEEAIENHIRACGMNMKKYKKIEGVVLKILDPKRFENPTPEILLKVFAKKCYGNFPEKDGMKQAKKFLKVLYRDLDYLVKEGPANALERASQVKKGSKPMMRIVRLNKPIDGFTKKLDCYLVGETIGKGATSVVKRGRREGEKKEEVAVKILTVDGKSFQLQELMKEIEVLRVLNHKNVIRMYDCFENVQYPGYTDKPTVVMVLELATKGELFDFFMHTGKFEPKLARWFFKQMIDGLEYCHSMKIAHRDLKPENLLMGEGFNVKLVDFGFARFFRDKKSGEDVDMKTALGTPGYAAPEILKRETYNNTVDIFSLGVILFICIAGFPPFQEAKASDWWFDKIIKKKFALFWKAHERCMKFDDDAKDLLLGMLAAQPADRYGWTKLRNHAWTNGKTFTQEEASTALLKLKRTVDTQLRKNARNKPHKVQRAIEHVDAPVLGSFLPVHHVFTSFNGKLALEDIRAYIMKVMFGKAELVKTELWVGPVPEEGLMNEHVSVETIEASKDDNNSGADLQKEKNVAIGFYWEDLNFTVDINKQDEEKGLDDDGLPKIANSIRVQGRVVVRQHPTQKSQNGMPLNVIYLKRIGYVQPHNWQVVSNTILQGVANIMEQTETRYFKELTKNSGLASSAVSSLLCCSTDAAKRLAE
jgi:serine/threonine protein kinase